MLSWMQCQGFAVQYGPFVLFCILNCITLMYMYQYTFNTLSGHPVRYNYYIEWLLSQGAQFFVFLFSLNIKNTFKALESVKLLALINIEISFYINVLVIPSLLCTCILRDKSKEYCSCGNSCPTQYWPTFTFFLFCFLSFVIDYCILGPNRIKSSCYDMPQSVMQCTWHK